MWTHCCSYLRPLSGHAKNAVRVSTWSTVVGNVPGFIIIEKKKNKKLGWLHHRLSSNSVEIQLHNIHRCSVDVIKRLTSTDKITNSESFSVAIFLI